MRSSWYGATVYVLERAYQLNSKLHALLHWATMVRDWQLVSSLQRVGWR